MRRFVLLFLTVLIAYAAPSLRAAPTSSSDQRELLPLLGDGIYACAGTYTLTSAPGDVAPQLVKYHQKLMRTTDPEARQQLHITLADLKHQQTGRHYEEQFTYLATTPTIYLKSLVIEDSKQEIFDELYNDRGIRINTMEDATQELFRNDAMYAQATYFPHEPETSYVYVTLPFNFGERDKYPINNPIFSLEQLHNDINEGFAESQPSPDDPLQRTLKQERGITTRWSFDDMNRLIKWEKAQNGKTFQLITFADFSTDDNFPHTITRQRIHVKTGKTFIKRSWEFTNVDDAPEPYTGPFIYKKGWQVNDSRVDPQVSYVMETDALRPVESLQFPSARRRFHEQVDELLITSVFTVARMFGADVPADPLNSPNY
jgi:hypothetical protein